MSTMTSTIYLCSNVPLSNRYDHTIYFADENAQRSYFTSKVDDTINDVSYLRKSWSIKIVADMDSARKWSYLFFQNHDNGKVWYYFVTNVEYINDNTVELFLELDVLQTYMFDWTLNPCFVEREHTESDNIGEHTIDEGLDTGDLIVNQTKEINWDDCCVLILSTVVLGVEGLPNVKGSRYNDIYGGAAIFAVNMSDWKALGEYLSLNAEKIDSIITMWMYPKDLITLENGESWADDHTFHNVLGCDFVNDSIFFNIRLDGYNPKNAKCLQYPYNFIYATNNAGGAAVYRYEQFGDHTDPRVNLFGTLSAEGVAYMYPLNYRGVQHNYDEGLQLGGFPQCSWNADTYKLWLAQNQNQQDLAMVMGGLTITAGAVATFATGGVAAIGGVAAMAQGASAIQQVMAQRADMAIQPPQARGNHSGSLNRVAGQLGYTFMAKSVDAAHAKAIDEFFTMYGYAVHRCKVPSICNRPYWTYVKTRDSNVTGNIPNGDLKKINEIFDAGVTFWVGGSHVGDYTLTNSPA